MTTTSTCEALGRDMATSWWTCAAQGTSPSACAASRIGYTAQTTTGTPSLVSIACMTMQGGFASELSQARKMMHSYQNQIPANAHWEAQAGEHCLA